MGEKTKIKVTPDSQRLQSLTLFPTWDSDDFLNMSPLIKTQGKYTTDHILMAGPWFRFRGRLESVSDNMLMGTVSAFNGETNKAWSRLTNTYETISGTAKQRGVDGISSIVVTEENYGEGSDCKHTTMEPRFLNMKVVLAKSLAHIHETNPEKQGMLAVTFVNKADHDRTREHNLVSVVGLKEFSSGHNSRVILHRKGGTEERSAI